MQWFGESWGAPICEPETHQPTPVGEQCLFCELPIKPGDQGLLVPHMLATCAEIRPWHQACWMASLFHDPATCPRCSRKLDE